jgi:hypothetical protein
MIKSTKLDVVPKKKGGGQHPLGLDENQLKELEQIAPNMTFSQISDYFNIGNTTFKRIQARQKEVEDTYKKGRLKGLNRATQLLWDKMENGDITALIFYLKTQWQWREQKDLNISNQDGSLKPPSPLLISFVDDSKKD